MQFMVVFATKKVDHKLNWKSSDWFEIVGNFSKAVQFRRRKSFFGIIDTRDSLVNDKVNKNDFDIDFQKMSHHKKNDRKLNRFFDHKLDTPLYNTKNFVQYCPGCHL